MPDLNIGMNKKEIRDFVQSVAEIKDLAPAKSPTIRLDDTDQNLVRIHDQWHTLNQSSNPTLGFTLVKLKEQHRLCELACGEIVTDQVIEKKMYFTPKNHWRTKCNNCGKWLSPQGDSLIDSAFIHNAYRIFWHHQPKD
jgi:hypothetical protein